MTSAIGLGGITVGARSVLRGLRRVLSEPALRRLAPFAWRGGPFVRTRLVADHFLPPSLAAAGRSSPIGASASHGLFIALFEFLDFASDTGRLTLVCCRIFYRTHPFTSHGFFKRLILVRC